MERSVIKEMQRKGRHKLGACPVIKPLCISASTLCNSVSQPHIYTFQIFLYFGPDKLTAMQQLPSSILVIPQFLSAAALAEMDALLPQITFEDGKNTATGAAREVKNNRQAVRTPNPAHQRAQEIVFHTLAQHPLVQMAFMPKAILPSTISKYSNGMTYGWHTDSPIMSNGQTIRVDLSCTVFLSDPESYTGGELVIHTATGFVPFKGNKGDAVIYPTTRLHCVNPVTAGERTAAVTWLQSFIKETEQRELIFQLKSVQESVAQRDPQSTENLLLLQIYSNMVRMWAEV